MKKKEDKIKISKVQSDYKSNKNLNLKIKTKYKKNSNCSVW